MSSKICNLGYPNRTALERSGLKHFALAWAVLGVGMPVHEIQFGVANSTSKYQSKQICFKSSRRFRKYNHVQWSQLVVKPFFKCGCKILPFIDAKNSNADTSNTLNRKTKRQYKASMNHANSLPDCVTRSSVWHNRSQRLAKDFPHQC